MRLKLNMEAAKIANFAISQYFNIFIIVATQTQWQTYFSNLALNFAIFTKWWKPYNIQSAVSVRVCLDNLHYFNIMSLSSVQCPKLHTLLLLPNIKYSILNWIFEELGNPAIFILLHKRRMWILAKRSIILALDLRV